MGEDSGTSLKTQAKKYQGFRSPGRVVDRFLKRMARLITRHTLRTFFVAALFMFSLWFALQIFRVNGLISGLQEYKKTTWNVSGGQAQLEWWYPTHIRLDHFGETMLVVHYDCLQSPCQVPAIFSIPPQGTMLFSTDVGTEKTWRQTPDLIFSGEQGELNLYIRPIPGSGPTSQPLTICPPRTGGQAGCEEPVVISVESKETAWWRNLVANLLADFALFSSIALVITGWILEENKRSDDQKRESIRKRLEELAVLREAQPAIYLQAMASTLMDSTGWPINCENLCQELYDLCNSSLTAEKNLEILSDAYMEDFETGESLHWNVLEAMEHFSSSKKLACFSDKDLYDLLNAFFPPQDCSKDEKVARQVQAALALADHERYGLWAHHMCVATLLQARKVSSKVASDTLDQELEKENKLLILDPRLAGLADTLKRQPHYAFKRSGKGYPAVVTFGEWSARQHSSIDSDGVRWLRQHYLFPQDPFLDKRSPFIDDGALLLRSFATPEGWEHLSSAINQGRSFLATAPSAWDADAMLLQHTTNLCDDAGTLESTLIAVGAVHPANLQEDPWRWLLGILADQWLNYLLIKPLALQCMFQEDQFNLIHLLLFTARSTNQLKAGINRKQQLLCAWLSSHGGFIQPNSAEKYETEMTQLRRILDKKIDLLEKTDWKISGVPDHVTRELWQHLRPTNQKKTYLLTALPGPYPSMQPAAIPSLDAWLQQLIEIVPLLEEQQVYFHVFSGLEPTSLLSSSRAQGMEIIPLHFACDQLVSALQGRLFITSEKRVNSLSRLFKVQPRFNPDMLLASQANGSMGQLVALGDQLLCKQGRESFSEPKIDIGRI